jgi:2-dehydropantoate 2-reductase
MKITVMGAGAVGCYYGGMLARAGHEVCLVGRPSHVEAVLRDGLLMETTSFKEHVRMSASTEPGAVEGAQLVLFCVKSTDTETSAEAIAPHLADDAVVLTLQNGVDNADRLQRAIRQPVVPTVVYVATEMAGPGHVLHHGRGDLVIGESPRSAAIADAFVAAGVPVQLSDNVAGALWAKLILNCAYNAMSAITQIPYGPLVEGAGVWDVMHDVVDECVAVANALQVRLPGDPWQAVQRLAATMPAQFSSTAQDLARGKRSEIDHLNGFIVRQGRALGVRTPVNAALHTLVKLIESKQPAAA